MELMQHAAGLDSGTSDPANTRIGSNARAGRQPGGTRFFPRYSGRTGSLLTVVTLAVGLFVYAPWLILLLLVVTYSGGAREAKFNTQSYYSIVSPLA